MSSSNTDLLNQPNEICIATLIDRVKECPVGRHRVYYKRNYYLTVRRFYELLFLVTYYSLRKSGHDGSHIEMSCRPRKVLYEITPDIVDTNRFWEFTVSWLWELPEVWYYGTSSRDALESISLVGQDDRLRTIREIKQCCIYAHRYLESDSILRTEVALERFGFCIQYTYENLSGLNQLDLKEIMGVRTLIEPDGVSSIPDLDEIPTNNRSFLEHYIHVCSLQEPEVDTGPCIQMLIAFTEFILKFVKHPLEHQEDCFRLDKDPSRFYQLSRCYAYRRFLALYVPRLSKAGSNSVPGLVPKHFDAFYEPIQEDATTLYKEGLPDRPVDVHMCLLALGTAMTSGTKDPVMDRHLRKYFTQDTRHNPDPLGLHPKTWPVPRYHKQRANGTLSLFEMIADWPFWSDEPDQNQIHPQPVEKFTIPKIPPRPIEWYPTEGVIDDWLNYRAPTMFPSGYQPTLGRRAFGPMIRLCDFAYRKDREDPQGRCVQCLERGPTLYLLRSCGHTFH